MPELQQPDIVGNFLSAYGTAQQNRQAQEATAFNQQRALKQDSMAEQKFGMDQQAHQFKIAEEVVDMLGNTADGDEAGFERAKQRWTQMGLPPEAVAGFTVKDLPMLRQKAGTQLRELQAQAQQANIRQSDAAAAASRRSGAGGGQGGAPSGYQWVRGADGNVSLAPITGGPADPNKIAPGEGTKVRTSNAQLDMLEKSLENYAADLSRTSTGGRIFTRGADVSRVESGHTDLLMQMKNMYELGVLNGPDYMLMTKIVEDPTSLMSSYRGTEGLAAQLDTVKSIIKRARTINASKLGGAQPTAATTPPPPPAGSAGTPATTPPPPPPGFRISQ